MSRIIAALLADVLDWRGLFIEAAADDFERLQRKYVNNARVMTSNAVVTPDNVELLFADQGVSHEFEVLSIDVDGSDYWIWEAVQSYKPRVVVIEYNASLPADDRLVQPRHHGAWDYSAFFGASLGALCALGDKKGYRLVHTDLTGTNAFFVRADLPGEFPLPELVPAHGENHYLLGLRIGEARPVPGHRYINLDDAEERPGGEI